MWLSPKAESEGDPAPGGRTRRWFLKVVSSPLVTTILGGVSVTLIGRALLPQGPPVPVPQAPTVLGYSMRNAVVGTFTSPWESVRLTAMRVVSDQTRLEDDA